MPLNDYYIAALTRERYFQHEKIKLVSPSGHVMFSSVQFSLFLPFQLYVYIYIYINIQIMKFEIKWRGSS